MDYEKLVSKIASIFHQDPLLKTFDIIIKPVADNNTAISYFEHNLGIESWCIKDLYVKVYNTIFCSNTGIESFFHHKLDLKFTFSDSPLFESCLLTALLLNPSVTTFWNMRKKLILNQKLEPKSELNFCRVVLSHKPKTTGAFNYRKWLIKEVSTSGQLNSNLIEEELELILDAAERHTNNHMAWDYGIWLLNDLPIGLLSNVLTTFWKSFQSWIEVHVSDYSALHFRQFLMKKLISDDTELTDPSFKKDVILYSLKILPKIFNTSATEMETFHQKLESTEFYQMALVFVELSLNEDLILFYENHEALWTHRRYLYHYFFLTSKKSFAESSRIRSTFISIMNFFEDEDSDLSSFIFFRIHEHFINNFKNAKNNYHLTRYENWLKNYTILDK